MTPRRTSSSLSKQPGLSLSLSLSAERDTLLPLDLVLGACLAQVQNMQLTKAFKIDYFLESKVSAESSLFRDSETE